MLKWRHHVMSHLSIFRNFWKPFLKHKMRYLMVSKKKNLSFVWGWDRKNLSRGLQFCILHTQKIFIFFLFSVAAISCIGVNCCQLMSGARIVLARIREVLEVTSAG